MIDSKREFQAQRGQAHADDRQNSALYCGFPHRDFAARHDVLPLSVSQGIRPFTAVFEAGSTSELAAETGTIERFVEREPSAVFGHGYSLDNSPPNITAPKL